MDGMDRFYLDGPLCSAAMWSCMERTWTTRNACENKELSFLMASVKTLCDLSEFGLTDKRCYTRTLEALYATYVNTFPPIDKKPGKHDGNFCESYTAKMTKTYLCADDSCSYDQMIVLERFQPWVELVENATSVYTNCNMTELCQYEDEEDYLEELEEEIEDEYEDYSYDYYDSDYNEEDEEEEEQEEGRGDGETDEDSEDEGMGDFLQDDMDLSPTGSNSGEQFGDGLDKPNVDKIATEENIVLGLVVIIAMAGVVVLCLVVVIYNRFHSSQMGSHRGYSKLMEEEGRMMHNEYS
ncbi:hypothetical protein RRG08_007995 [Elysia crispata]|uniref:Uncharacterized protein n=1 Tax=Elysia crispata TaxID=231223 RepID=A0AAE1E8I5_9GAST|nr:hypothetical protein RRG08_007995 [Elysia crispata]